MNTADTFFEIPKINSKRYWDTRIEDFRNKTDVSVRERESFFLEFSSVATLTTNHKYPKN